MLCKRCGTEIPDTSKYCSECGIKVWKPPTHQEELADKLQELRYKHKMNIITDMEYEKRKYNLLHPEAAAQAAKEASAHAADKKDEDKRETLATQLRELRDMYKLDIISATEYERRKYILLHPVQTEPPKEDPAKEKAAARQEILADQLREIRDMHRLNIITGMEYELRRYNLLHSNQIKENKD